MLEWHLIPKSVSTLAWQERLVEAESFRVFLNRVFTGFRDLMVSIVKGYFTFCWFLGMRFDFDTIGQRLYGFVRVKPVSPIVRFFELIKFRNRNR